MEKRVILIGHGQIPRVGILKMLIKKQEEPESGPKCKRCGATNTLLRNGYCFDCEEELELEAK